MGWPVCLKGGEGGEIAYPNQFTKYRTILGTVSGKDS